MRAAAAPRTLLLLVLLSGPAPLARADDATAALAAVQGFFDAMAASDPAAGAAVLVPEGRFFAVNRTERGLTRTQVDNDFFLDRLGEPGPALLERMWDPDVAVHGDIATVTARYDFHRDGAYSHCGTDVFNLVRTDAGWRVAGGVFTREALCPDNPLAPVPAP
ncbi:MAG TPA: nuclear transport factor 2 family protein [Pseudomonadales bacterium]|nr:nuclear transport factor 2 family protein [Pseudomonadales bacterium]